MNWIEQGYAVIDTETTGFGRSARVLEVAVVLFQGLEVVHQKSWLLNPPDVDWGDDKVKEAMGINKIAREDLLNKPTFDQIVPDLLLELSHPVWVAHNTPFDMRMLWQELERVGHKEWPLRPEYTFDTCALSRHFHPAAKGHNLLDTATRWGVTPDGAHRASSDAITCGRILSAMASLLPEDLAQVDSIHRKAPSHGR